MKKIIAFVMIMLMLPCFSIAESSRSDAFSFCELYTQRLDNFESSTGIDIANISDYYYNDLNVSLGQVSCCAGTITINQDDWTVREFMTEIYASYDSSNQTRLMSAIIAMSALEYGVDDEAELKYIEKTDPINKTFSIYTTRIADFLTKDGMNKLDKKEAVKVYEGNYTYYLQYYEASNGTIVVYLIAK